MFRHLTHTGYDAGKPICGAPMSAKTKDDLHAMYAPLHLEKIRVTCCPKCLTAWCATYDDDEEKPQWVIDWLSLIEKHTHN